MSSPCSQRKEPKGFFDAGGIGTTAGTDASSRLLMYQSMKRTVRVWDKQYEISSYQTSKSVWVAVGEYEGRRVEVKGSSASSAAKHWQATAHYWGNIGLPPDRT